MSERPEAEMHDDLGFLQEMVDAARSDRPQEAEWQAARRNLINRVESKPKENRIVSILRNTNRVKLRWAVAAAIAVCLLVFVVAVNPLDRGSGQAFAAVLEQIRNARTVTFTTVTRIEGLGEKGTSRMERAYKTPGLMRVTGPGVVSITDLRRKKSLVILAPTRQYIEMDLPSVSGELARTSFIEGLKALPDLADKVLKEQTIDGHTVRGYHVTMAGLEQTLWVDVKTDRLVRIEGTMVNEPGLQIVASDFKFDVELDDSLFSLTPPEGYSAVKVKADMSKPEPRHLIGMLRDWAELSTDGLFPPELEAAAMVKAVEEMGRAGKLRKTEKETTEDDALKQVMEQALEATFGHMFVLQMEPENDWHYAGKGVKLGEAEKPVCWWKPKDSKTFRVVYGDLSIRDVKPEEVREFPSTR